MYLALSRSLTPCSSALRFLTGVIPEGFSTLPYLARQPDYDGQVVRQVLEPELIDHVPPLHRRHVLAEGPFE